jgi:hypothetical protein
MTFCGESDGGIALSEAHKHKERADDHALPGTVASLYHREESSS